MPTIYGKIGNPNETADAELAAMSQAVANRNSRPRQFSNSRGVAFGYCDADARRSETPMQPFVSGAICCVFDGHIFNRRLLASTPVAAEAATPPNDAELAVSLYKRYGQGFVEKLRGPFALALWDDNKRELFMARDHLGHRPLFFAQMDTGFYFASEPKCLLAPGIVPFELDLEALSHFLSFRFLPAPHYLVRGIRKLGPATFLRYRNSRVETNRYWAPSFRKKLALKRGDLIGGLNEKLHEAISLQVDNSGEIGAFLSGGLDSGLIVAYMAKSLDRNFHTFSLGVRDATDEVPLSSLVASMYGTQQHVSYVGGDVIRSLPSMVACLDEPTDMVIVSKYTGALLAAPHVSTVLSGDGGDELFGGFPRYIGVRDARYLQMVPSPIRGRMLNLVVKYARGHARMESLPGKIEWMLDVAKAGDLPRRYAEAVAYPRFRESAKRLVLTDEVNSEIAGIDSYRLLADIVRRADADDPVEKLLYTDYLTRLPEHLLMLDDRTGRANGLNVRCPYADRELVDYVAAIPANLKIRGRKAKYIESRIAEKMLPAEIVRNRKTGWRFPFSELFAGDLNPFLRSVCKDSLLIENHIFRESFIDRMLTEHEHRANDHHVRLWMLLTLEIWYRMYGSRQSCGDVTAWLDRHLEAPR